jgi:hypothetical protein
LLKGEARADVEALKRRQVRQYVESWATDANGRLLYPEQVYGAIKKSGKTGFAAMFMITTLLLYGGRYAEGYCCANGDVNSTSWTLKHMVSERKPN